jgi:HEAT repeat protein
MQREEQTMLSPQELHRQLDAEPFLAQSQMDELINRLHDPTNPQARQAAALALGQVATGAPSEWRAIEWRAVKPLLVALQDPLEMVRVAAATSLGRIGAPEAVPPLILFLKQESVVQRRCAVEALGKIGDPRAVEPLLAALADNCHRVRIAALRALGHIGDRRAEEALIAALGDGDVCTRLAAAAALSEMTRTSLARTRAGMDEPQTPLS